MKFVILLSVFLFCQILANSSDVEREEFKCVDGVPYEENDCNGCFCNRGRLGCTLMACSTHEDSRYRGCDVGTTWAKGCNKCWCVQDLGTVCTVNKC